MAQFTRTDVLAAIEGLFSSWSLTPASTVAFERTGFDVSSMGGPWLEVLTQVGQMAAATVGLYQSASGIVYVTGFAPMELGRPVARQMLDAASALLLGVARVQVGQDGAHLQITRTTGEIPRSETGFVGLQTGFHFSVL